MRPVVDRLADMYGDQLQVLPLNAAREGREAFRGAGLRGHPAYLVLDAKGREQWRAVGVVDFRVLEEAVADLVDQ